MKPFAVEVESVLNTHLAIAASAVAATLDPVRGDEVLASRGARNAPTACFSAMIASDPRNEAPMRIRGTCTLFLAAWLAAAPVHAAPPSTRAQALQALEGQDTAARLTGIARLAEIGRMADVGRLLARLTDDDAEVRALAAAATWQIWSRSGDPAIDKLFASGVAQMRASAWADALATFTTIVQRKPDFAEGWNKRATLYFLLGRNVESLKDCDEVLKRNPKHFGALAGAGQIHLQLGHAELALDFFRRAVAVNPNMEGPAEMIPMLEELLRNQRPNRT